MADAHASEACVPCGREGSTPSVSTVHAVVHLLCVCTMKYTKVGLEPFAREVRSFRALAQAIGLAPNGGSQTYLKKVVIKLGVDTSHFMGQGANRGVFYKGGSEKLIPSSVLVLDRRSGIKEPTARLRRALLDSGIPERCVGCGLGSEWNGHPLVLQIDHENGNSLDNRPGNPRFLCPNCHTQTSNYGAKNSRRCTIS
jgi:hypothetical protein